MRPPPVRRLLMPWPARLLRLAVLMAMCAATPATATDPPLPPAPASIRVDRMRHGAADRVIVWLPRGSAFAAQQQGADLVLTLPALRSLAPDDLAAARVPGRWIQTITTASGSARLTLARGARPRVWPWRDRVVIDVDDTLLPLRLGQYRPEMVAIGTGPMVARIAPAPPSPRQPGRADMPVNGSAPAPSPVPRGALPAGGRPSAAPAASQGPAASGNRQPLQPASASTAPQRGTLQEAGAASALPPAESEAPQTPATAPPAGGRGTASAILLGADTASGGESVLLPTDGPTGAAAFMRGGELRIVLDAARLLDLSGLKDDPAFGAATERLLPDGMELRLHPLADAQPRLARVAQGWVLTLATAPLPVPPVTARVKDGVLFLNAALPGHVVVVEDEASGSRLLVGTQRGAGQRVAGGHRAAEWVLLPSLQGVVVQPLSDRVVLQDRDAGFELKAADPPALALLWPDGTDPMGQAGRTMTRRFDLPGLPVPVLRRRLAEALRDAALAPRTGRTAPRLRVAEAMLACGLDAEASAVLRVALADDPAAHDDPVLGGLRQIAAWLEARAGGAAPAAAAFDPTTLGASDEANLWRALWAPPGGDAAAAAATVAPRWRLLLDYPDHLRRPMLPAVAEVLARGGQDEALQAMLAAFPDASLDLMRAGLLQRQGKAQDSLRVLDRLSTGTDRLVRAQALEAAVEQRLAAHQLTPAAAADQLERQFYAWRGGDRELRLRLRTADLRAQAGGWRAALALLREADGLFPAGHGRIHDAEINMVSALLHSDKAAGLQALDLIALADDASRLLGAADADAALAPLLADRLLSLDLPAQAEPIIGRLLDRAGNGPAKGALGLRLAELLADREDPVAALAVLDRTSGGMSDAVQAEGRALLRARVLAATGHAPDALALLAGMTSRPAVELAASLHESDHDWPDAVRMLQTLSNSAAFVAMASESRQDLVLRIARDAAEAHDMAALRKLRVAYGGLFAGGTNAGLFAVLTADPVQRVDDLPRAAHELVAMRALSGELSRAAPPR